MKQLKSFTIGGIIFVAALVVLLSYYSCTEKDLITQKKIANIESASSTDNGCKLGPHTERSESGGDPDEADTLSNNTATPSTDSVSKVSGILVFETMTAFNTVMQTLVNQTDEALNTWEHDLNFSSLRTYYNNIEDEDETDAFLIDSIRLPGKAFESILNEGASVQIGDSLYYFNPDSNYFVMSVFDPTTKELYYTRNCNKNGSGCWTNKSTEPTRHYNFSGTEYKIAGKKWIHNYGIWSEIGMKTKTWKWERHWLFGWRWRNWDAPSIHAYLDIKSWGYELVFHAGTSCSAPNYEKENVRKNAFNDNKVRHLFDWAAGAGSYRWVSKYGRIHHWFYGHWNDDCHNNNW